MLCIAEMADTLSVESLGAMLNREDSSSGIILIDCRPFLVLNTSRIKGANDVHCPPIVKRRSGGNIPLGSIFRNSSTRSSFLEKDYTSIVVYDESTSDLADLPKDSNMYLVIKTLIDEDEDHKVYFLDGGFQSFQSLFPNLCTTVGATATSGQSGQGQLVTSFSGCNQSFQLNVTSHCSYGNSPASTPYKGQSGPAEVLPWLYIGDLHHAMQVDNMLDIGITALINMAASTEGSPLPNPRFCQKNIPVRDSCSADIISWFPEVLTYIDNVRKKGGKVLVHCQAGISRSATACIAYLMYHRALSLDAAFDFLRSKRSVVSPNLNFMRQLTEFEVQIREGTTGLQPRTPTLTLPTIVEERRNSISFNLSASSLVGYTPCTQQPHTFQFDMPQLLSSPTCTPYLPSPVCSPSLPLPSPLMSPS